KVPNGLSSEFCSLGSILELASEEYGWYKSTSRMLWLFESFKKPEEFLMFTLPVQSVEYENKEFPELRE
ncbi:hypothetical protein NPIL_124281, partial [Nephila pilipes]